MGELRNLFEQNRDKGEKLYTQAEMNVVFKRFEDAEKENQRLKEEVRRLRLEVKYGDE